MDGIDDRVVLLRACHGKYLGVPRGDQFWRCAETPCHDDPAVLGNCFADCRERLLARAVNEATGVDDHDVGAAMVRRRCIAFCTKPSQDPLGIDERFRAAQAHESDARGAEVGIRHGHSARF